MENSLGTAAEYEKTLILIPAVIGVRVVMDAQRITAIHVLSSTSRHPMQIVRDIESILMASFDLRVDRQCVSVAQIDLGTPGAPRLVLDSVQLSIYGNEAEVRAQLHWQDKKLLGCATGVATRKGRLVLAAQAVLRAASQLLPNEAHLVLETLDTLALDTDNAVLVLVSLVQGQRTQSLVGAAFTRRDDTEAAGRATLAAVNRRLEMLVSH